MTRSPNKLIPSDFTPTPSLAGQPNLAVVDTLDAASLDAVAVLVASDGDLPQGLPLDRVEQAAAGFDAEPGSTLLVPGTGAPLLVLVGAGASADVDAAVRANLSSGPGRAAIEQAGAERARDAIAAALDQFVQADGTVHLDNVFRVVIARA